MLLRLVLLFGLVAGISGCGSSPVSPNDSMTPIQLPPVEPATRNGSLYGMVVESSGACLEGAKVEVIAGQAIGNVALQETPCGIWDYGGGFWIKSLTLDVATTIRASAPGYSSRELATMPQSGGTGLVIILSPLQ